MIIDDDHRFAFIHIPKCAGTSVRNILGRFDTTGKLFTNRIVQHSTLGCIDMEHIPLFILRENFPDYFDKVRSYYSLAIVRNPYKRFPSSLSQYLVTRSDKPLRWMTKSQFAAAVEEVVSSLSEAGVGGMLPHELIHFQHQYAFVFDRDEQIVSNLYTIDDIRMMLTDLEERIGSQLWENAAESERIRRKAMVYRSAAISYAASAVKSIFPATVRRRIPKRMEDALRGAILVHRDAKFRSIFESEFVRGFIVEHYERDFELYETVASQKRR